MIIVGALIAAVVVGAPYVVHRIVETRWRETERLIGAVRPVLSPADRLFGPDVRREARRALWEIEELRVRLDWAVSELSDDARARYHRLVVD